MDEQTERSAVEQLRHDAHAETAATAERAGRRWVPFTVVGSLLVSLLAAVTVLIYGMSVLGHIEATDAAVTEVRRLAEEAKTAGEAANTALLQRGQPPVPIPEPGEAEDSEVLVAAATAQVLEMLPDTSPTDAELADAIVRVAAANRQLFAPSPQQIATEVAGYFTLNPPPTGPPGPSGTPGRNGQDGADGRDGQDAPPPTAEELQAAVGAHLRDNPDALCPLGGRFAELRVRLADGGTADTWQCVVAVQAPTTTDRPIPPLLPPGR